MTAKLNLTIGCWFWKKEKEIVWKNYLSICINLTKIDDDILNSFYHCVHVQKRWIFPFAIFNGIGICSCYGGDEFSKSGVCLKIEDNSFALKNFLLKISKFFWFSVVFIETQKLRII